MAFLAANSFFCAFSKIATKRTPIKKNFGGFFFKNKKKNFRGSKIVVFKTRISNLFPAFVLLCKKEASCQFSPKNINIYIDPLEFFENENFAAHARAKNVDLDS